MNAWTTGSMVLVSAGFPSKAETSAGTGLAGEQGDGDLRVKAALPGEPRLAEPVPGVGLEVQGADVAEDQARPAQPGVRRADGEQRLPPRLSGARPDSPAPAAIRRTCDRPAPTARPGIRCRAAGARRPAPAPPARSSTKRRSQPTGLLSRVAGYHSPGGPVSMLSRHKRPGQAAIGAGR